MPTPSFSEEITVRSRRFAHLAILRLLLAIAYAVIEVNFNPAGASALKYTVAGLFFAYSAFIVAYRSDVRVRAAALSIQFVDLISTVVLVLLSNTGEVALPLLMFYFLLTEGSLLHGAREVLLVTMVSVVFYSAWLRSGEAGEFQFSYSSFMFMLVVGGALAYYYSEHKNRTVRRISGVLRQAAGKSEEDMARAVESALQELVAWLRCSRAILAFWDDRLDYVAICQYPPQRNSSSKPPAKFEASREWACFRGTRLDFHTNDVSLVDKSRKPIDRGFDLHSYVIQKFEIYNALGCGLWDGDKPLGRLLVLNRVSEFRHLHWKQLQPLAPSFRELVRHLLVVKNTEHEAYEQERGRIAHDLHDGPLQSMISFEMRLQIIRTLLERNPPAGAEQLESLQQLSRKLVAEMRTFLLRMRPLETGESSLMASARRLVEGFQKESGVSVTFVGAENGDVSLPGKLGPEVLQIVREALHNIYKHAQATHVLFAAEKKGNHLHIAVDDNGRGFRFGGKYTLEELELLGLGPRSIKRRVRALGGELTVESHPGHGSNLRLAVPLYG